MKKKLILICIAVAAVALCTTFFVWRNKDVADIIDLNTITRVEMMGHYEYVNLTKKEDIEELTNILDSMKLKKCIRYEVGVAGGAYLNIFIYHENNNKNDMFVRPERLMIDGQWYKGKESYRDDLIEFYRRFSKHKKEEE